MDFKDIHEPKDIPLTLVTIQAFREMLDIMEEFIRNTEQERLGNERPE